MLVIKVAYGVVLVGTLIGTVVLGGIFFRQWRMRSRRPMVARWLLFCCASLVSLAFAETIAFAWHAPDPFVPSLVTSDPELPDQFTEPHNDSEVTLVVLGESSAAGTPYEAWLSVGRIVAWQLGEVIPDRRFDAVVLAKPCETLEIQYRKLAGIRRRPDVVIVYCGHNEFFSRMPWSRKVAHYRDDKPPVEERLVLLADRVSPLCGLIQQAVDTYRIGVVPPSTLEPPLVDVPAFTPAEFATILADFRRRLEAITTYSERVGAMPILVVPPGNDAGFEPLRSFLPPETTRAQREAFARDFRAVRRLESSDWEHCIDELPRLCWLASPRSPSRTTGWRRCWNEPERGTRPINTTSRLATSTVCRCAA